jgi:hypothetical protein
MGTKSAPRPKATTSISADLAVERRFSRERMKAVSAPTAPPGMRKVTMTIMLRVAAMTMRATMAPRPG